MNLQSRKIDFVQEFLKIQNEDLITRLEKILWSNQSKQTADIKPMTTAELNNRIEKSMKDSENNNLTTSTDLISEIEKWS